MTRKEAVQIKQRGPFWMVLVQDEPHARYPTVPCYHTAGVYYSETDALVLVSELIAAVVA